MPYLQFLVITHTSILKLIKYQLALLFCIFIYEPLENTLYLTSIEIICDTNDI